MNLSHVYKSRKKQQ